ncbi:DUF1206 domain-containing protein [Oerskovia sp. Sa2CUA8]|uniref:DUF1206 domain-containing protein n=1 Tax=Oerskovia gallyi TaxID=2762226 RepID=A0ABR8UXM3_9CELL|nr:DUF1206 domain-containing protein [Oerskovia gallyi]
MPPPSTRRRSTVPTGTNRTTSGTAQQLQQSKGLRVLARTGYAVSGLLHIMIGIIAIRIATGSGGGQASETGALQEIAGTTGGEFVLWFAVVAFVALGLWQILEAIAGTSGNVKDRKAYRAKSAGKAVVYLALAVLTFKVVSGSGSGGQQDSLTASLLANGAGRVLVGAVGVGIVVAGAYHVVKGWKKRFLQDLEGNAGGQVGHAVVVLGKVGYIAKGIALGVLGALVVAAAVTADPAKASGLDAALRTIGEQPFGAFLLAATGIGFAAYGVYSFARARYARM